MGCFPGFGFVDWNNKDFTPAYCTWEHQLISRRIETVIHCVSWAHLSQQQSNEITGLTEVAFRIYFTMQLFTTQKVFKEKVEFVAGGQLV